MPWLEEMSARDYSRRDLGWARNEGEVEQGDEEGKHKEGRLSPTV